MKTIVQLLGFPKYDPDGTVVVEFRLPEDVQDRLRPLLGPPSFDIQVSQKQAQNIVAEAAAFDGLDWFLEECTSL